MANKFIRVVFNDDTPGEDITDFIDAVSFLLEDMNITTVMFVGEEEECHDVQDA